jgi:hypothetical protein
MLISVQAVLVADEERVPDVNKVMHICCTDVMFTS